MNWSKDDLMEYLKARASYGSPIGKKLVQLSKDELEYLAGLVEADKEGAA